MGPLISVAICTHNPRTDQFQRVLTAVRQQDLPLTEWELVVVDNASDRPVTEQYDLSWHPAGRCVREELPGLLNARRRAVRETDGDIIVFVDDDNVLALDYLSRVSDLFGRYPSLGVAGGSIAAEFETDPPSWMMPYIGYLAVGEVTGEQHLASVSQWRETPCGAGMCVRRSVAESHSRLVDGDAARQALERKGDVLSGSGDIDLALCAFDLGMTMLRSPQLRLTHLVAAERLTESYMTQLLEASAKSSTQLMMLRGFRRRPPWLRRILSRLRRLPRVRPGDRRMTGLMERALDRGELAALREG